MQNHSHRMRRLLASDLLPDRAGQPVKALVHVSFADLCEMDQDSALQAKWIEQYRAAWAAHRAAASVSTGDGGAWLDGDDARTVTRDAMVIPVVTGDLDPGAVDQLIGLCVQYDRLRGHAHAADPGTGADPDCDGGALVPARPDGRPGCWPCWSTRSWPRSSRSCPGPAEWPRSCAVTCWAGA
jgi:hypothetical protein